MTIGSGMTIMVRLLATALIVSGPPAFATAGISIFSTVAPRTGATSRTGGKRLTPIGTADPSSPSFFRIDRFATLAPLDLTYATTYASMGNVVALGTGNRVSYCPELSCLSTSPTHGSAPYDDHQRTSFLLSAQTQIDDQAEEQTLGINTLIATGAKANWAAVTAYGLGSNVQSNGQIYRAVRAGTSASSGSGPGGFGAHGTWTQTDGSVTWKWINASAIAAKLSAYIETAMEGGAGFTEGLTTNFQMLSAHYAPNGIAADPSQGATGIEHDFSNNSGTDCAIGQCVGLAMDFTGTNSTWVGMSFDGGGGSHGGRLGTTSIGLRMGDRLAQSADIAIVDNAQIGLLIGNDTGLGGNSGPTGHATASILDNAASLVGIDLSGSYANGLSFNGAFKSAQVAGHGWAVDPAGALTAYQLRLQPDSVHQVTIGYSTAADQTQLQSTHLGVYNTQLMLNPAGGVVSAGPSGFSETLTTPRSSSASCFAGQFTDDANYHYVCVATDTWKRVALSAF